MLTVCCRCDRVKELEAWVVYYRETIQEPISHGYCPDCYTELMDELSLSLTHKGKARAEFLSRRAFSSFSGLPSPVFFQIRDLDRPANYFQQSDGKHELSIMQPGLCRYPAPFITVFYVTLLCGVTLCRTYKTERISSGKKLLWYRMAK